MSIDIIRWLSYPPVFIAVSTVWLILWFNIIKWLLRYIFSNENNLQKKNYQNEMSIYDDSRVEAIDYLPTGIDLETLMAQDGEMPDYHQERSIEKKM